MTEYHRTKEGEWNWIPWAGGKDQCCDCGLTHVNDYRTSCGTLEIKTRVDHIETASRRYQLQSNGKLVHIASAHNQKLEHAIRNALELLECHPARIGEAQGILRACLPES